MVLWKKKFQIKETDDHRNRNDETYKEGYLELKKGDVFLLQKNLMKQNYYFPQSEWAPKSALMAAYAYYTQDYYSDAIFELERDIKLIQ